MVLPLDLHSHLAAVLAPKSRGGGGNTKNPNLDLNPDAV